MFDFEYTLTLADCATLIDPSVSDIIEEHSAIMEESENGCHYSF